jgi:hypothetical protein
MVQDGADNLWQKKGISRRFQHRCH